MNNIEMMDISLIKPYLNNPRKISKKAVEAVANSIKLYGFQQAVVIDRENVIVVGHTRAQAAIQLGMKEVPVKYAKKKNGKWLTPDECDAYRLADNKTGEEAGWDSKLLNEELQKMRQSGMFSGFDDDEIKYRVDSEVSKIMDREIKELETEHECPKCGYKW